MRLLFGLLGAVVCHGLVFGVAIALLPRQAARPVAVAALDVDVVPARPDPVAPLPPAARPAEPERPARHVHARPQPPAVPSADPAPPPPAEADVSQGAGASSPPAAAAATGVAPARVTAPVAVSALSAQPRYRSNPVPEYPSAARRLREEGIVLVRVAVAADGLPTEVTVERSCGHPLLDDAAVEAVRRWTFEPARAAGTPVPSLVVVPVRFSLAEGR